MVGTMLRRERLEWQRLTGLPIRRVTAALGISRPTLFLWENDAKGKPDPRDIRRLLSLYGCSEAKIAEALRLRSMPVDASEDLQDTNVSSLSRADRLTPVSWPPERIEDDLPTEEV